MTISLNKTHTIESSIQKEPDINKCSICLNYPKEYAVISKCGHIFHSVCILPFLPVRASNISCPICREPNFVDGLKSVPNSISDEVNKALQIDSSTREVVYKLISFAELYEKNLELYEIACKRIKISLKQYFTPEISRSDTEGLTPLHRACMENNITNVEKLLEQNVNPNITTDILNEDGDWTNITPLMIAANGGYSKIVSALLEANANLDTISIENKSVFDYAYENTHFGCLNLLIKKYKERYFNRSKEIHSSEITNMTMAPTLFYLLKTNLIGISAIDSLGYNLLHRAVESESPTKVKAILYSGKKIDINAETVFKQTALKIAEENVYRNWLGNFPKKHQKATEIYNILVQRGAK
jgi:ankyrin repeat protein